MKQLARLTLRGRYTELLAVAATLLFSAVVIGAFGVLLDTGVRGQVETGEYGRVPMLLGPPQSVPVSGDTDMPIPGRALLAQPAVDAVVTAASPSRVVTDRIVPAMLAGSGGQPATVNVHQWSAFALGNRLLVSGREPTGPGEIVLPRGLAGAVGLQQGAVAELGFGDAPDRYRVVGLTSADDAGIDEPDVYLADDEVAAPGDPERRVAVVGVWPAAGTTARLDDVAKRYGLRVWTPGERGGIEVVSQGRAKAALVSVAGAAGALACIVAVFTVLALISLHVRERSRELALFRIVGATPRQVKRLLRAELRLVAVLACIPGAVAGPLLGVMLIDAIRAWGVLPRGMRPIIGPLPFAAALVVGLATAEIATRIALRRVVRASPLQLFIGADDGPDRSARKVMRTAFGLLLLSAGIVMAAAPWYASGEAASALPGLSGLVIAVSIGPLSPLVVRIATRMLRRTRCSAPVHLALRSISYRAARVGAALAPIVLGVTVGIVQLFSPVTMNAVAGDQVRAGYRADFVVSSDTGVGDQTAALVRSVPGVDAADAIVRSSIIAHVGGSDTVQTLSALAMAPGSIDHFADLAPEDDSLPLRSGEIALGVQAAAELNAHPDDELSIVLPDGRAISRRVSGTYLRGLGFGDAVVSISDLQPTTPSGLPSALAITIATNASAADVRSRIQRLLAERPGLLVSRSPVASSSGDADGDAGFQLLLLAMIFGYITIAVVNSLVVAMVSRAPEFRLLSAAGATPRQQRRVCWWEAVFIAGTACVVGTLAALPGLCAMTFSLSNCKRIVPAVDPGRYALIIGLAFAVVLAATALPARAVVRRRGSHRPQ